MIHITLTDDDGVVLDSTSVEDSEWYEAQTNWSMAHAIVSSLAVGK